MAIAPTAGPGTSAGLVRTLLAEQAPALAGLPVERLADGWDNHTFRLGERMVVRLPRHEAAAELHADEVRWLPELGPQLTTATPQPVAVGGPSPHFPHPWSVVEYIPGREAAAVPPAERVALAEDLADFTWSLHVPAPTHAPVNPFRGGSLATEAADARVRSRLADLARSGHAELAEALLPRWEAWSHAPDFDGVDVWLHGDLHPHNIVIGADGRLAGVVDWGDVTAGDPACDLATAWLTFDATGRRLFTERLEEGHPVDAATWVRARAWALHLGLVLLSRPDEFPRLVASGRHALDELCREDV